MKEELSNLLRNYKALAGLTVRTWAADNGQRPGGAQALGLTTLLLGNLAPGIYLGKRGLSGALGAAAGRRAPP